MIERLVNLVGWLGEARIVSKRVLEIGSGGDQLARLLACQASHVVVYEPCIHVRKEMFPEDNIALVTSTYPRGDLEKVNLVICRQVIEHLANPIEMLTNIRQSLGTGGYAYIEVPDSGYIVGNAAVDDLSVQHVQYFSRANMAAILGRCGLYPKRWIDIKGGHDFGVLAQAGNGDEIDLVPFKKSALSDLGNRFCNRISAARRHVMTLPGPIAIYGATTQSQSFINFMDGAISIAAVIDDGAEKVGWMLYDRTQRIKVEHGDNVDISSYATIIIGAYLHETAIAARLRENGYSGTLVSIRPHPAGGDAVASLYRPEIN